MLFVSLRYYTIRMKLKIELTKSSQQILIVDKTHSSLSSNLRGFLKKYENTVFISPHLPQNLRPFTMIFSINEKIPLWKIYDYPECQFILIFSKKTQSIEQYKRLSLTNTKIIIIDGDIDLSLENLNNLFWFVFSKSDERLFNIYQIKKSHPPTTSVPSKRRIKLKPKIIFFIFLMIFFLYQLLFIPLIATSSYLYYQSIKRLKADELKKSRLLLTRADYFFSLGKSGYRGPQHLYRLFGLASFFDDLISLNEKLALVIRRSEIINENSRKIFRLFLKKNKTRQEKDLLSLTIKQLAKELNSLTEDLAYIDQKIPDYIPNRLKIKNDLSAVIELVQRTKKFSPFVEEILAKGTEKKYLLLFANNMEIRPGGGFIGSYGVLTLNDLTFEDLKIYDVYDADGQLIGHVEPPESVRKYLNQPHWFLRDSAYSGDFVENYNTAQFFLRKEVNLTDFNGGILLTTSSIQNILSAFGKFYLPDFKESITADNFYIIAQIHSEKNFFPGSTQKKSFLSSIARYLINNIDTAKASLILKGIKKSLDEKQMVVIIDNNNIQAVIDSLYWSGKITQPQCPPNLNNCLTDYLFPLDANLGVNKANFYVTRSIESNIAFDKDGYFHNKLTIKYRNDSPKTAYPGGPYKNYFQILLSPNVIVKQVTKNDVTIEDIDQSIDQLKKVGFFFVLEPNSSTEIKIEYQSANKLDKGQAYYQLLIQKQIGYSNNDLALRIYLPQNLHLVNQNFSPLVKDSLILYNTQLSTDKIFFIELLKE